MRISDLSSQITSLSKLPATKEKADEVEEGAKKVADFISGIDWKKISAREAEDLSKAGKLLHQQTAPRFREAVKEFDKLEEHLPHGDLSKAKEDFNKLSLSIFKPKDLSELYKKYGKDVLTYLMKDPKFALGFSINCAQFNPDFLMGLDRDLFDVLSVKELEQVGARIADPDQQKAFSKTHDLSLDAVKRARADFLKSHA